MTGAEFATLSARDIVKSYDGRTVLDGVDVTVATGEWVGLIGPSGSGKTTLLSIVGGLLAADRGHVEFLGSRSTEPVAWVLQTTNALGRRSVRDNAALGGLSDGLPEPLAAERAEHVLAQLGLAEMLEAPAGTLSGGERQRLAIARALTSTRPFLLADEPTGQLDRDTSARVVERMRDASGAVGVLLATHDTELHRWCDRILRLVDGRLVSDG